MVAFTTFVNEIETNTPYDQVNIFLACAVEQINISENANAVLLLNKASLLIIDFINTIDNPYDFDYTISQIAFEYARAGDKQKAQTAISNIVSEEIKQETYIRIAKEIFKTDATLALNIITTYVTDQKELDDFNAAYALYLVKNGNVTDAKTYNNNIVSVDKKRANYVNILREYAKQTFT